MALTTLAYGTEGLDIDVPTDRTTIVKPQHGLAAEDAAATLRTALQHPVAGPRLRDIVSPGQRVVVSICDVTRPQPRQLMIEALLEELHGIVGPGDLTLLVATGTHRVCTAEELREMLGAELLDTCEVVNHDARDDAELVDVGMHGNQIKTRLHRRWVEADVRITTGFVEPHFFAGFSGGPKMVAPGLASLDTVMALHNAARIGHPKATWGVCEGNPVHDDVRAIATATGVDLAFDVVLNRDQRIIAAFAGEVLSMHREARKMSCSFAMQGVDSPFDVVVTTNSGYPLDRNLYQSVKGMTAAMKVVKPGGLIICAAACADGLPEDGAYAELLGSASSPAQLLKEIEGRSWTAPDQWQVQMQAHVQEHARVRMRTDGLSDAQLRAAHLEPCHDVENAVLDELEPVGPNARVCVLPEGPQTIPYVLPPGT